MEAAKKIDRAALKKMAKGQLKGNWGWAVCLTLVSAVILGVLNGWPAFFMDSGDNSINNVAVVLDVFGGILGGLISSPSFQFAILAILLFFHGCSVLRCDIVFHDFFAHVA